MIYMANNRKVLQISSKHRTRAEKAQREYEESLVQSDGIDLDDVSASQFVNTTARKEYGRALKRLREEVGMVGNLNKSDLLNYAKQLWPVYGSGKRSPERKTLPTSLKPEAGRSRTR